MDKEVVKQLQIEIKECVNNKNFDYAIELYQKQLHEMSDKIKSYNPKLEEYMIFLREHANSSLINNIEKELNRVVNDCYVPIIERYSLFMLVGNKLYEWKDNEHAKQWFEKAEEIHNAGYIKSDKAKKMLAKING